MEDYSVLTENHDMMLLCEKYCAEKGNCDVYKSLVSGNVLDERALCPCLDVDDVRF
jgi:hypothetical protein